MDDTALLREYATRHSEPAFEELVKRRIGFVYSAALRQVREPHLAEEVTQAVFVILAQKAGKISGGGWLQRGIEDEDQRRAVASTNLMGWLFKATRFTALAQIRAAVRRQRHEKEVEMQTGLQSAAAGEMWNQISPLLDKALAVLGKKDRQVVLLRFFENKSLAEVGSSLGMGEDTARKRVSRALEKLHRYFNRRGISSTTAIIAGEISANSIQPMVPAALAKSVTAAALAKGTAASTSTLTLIKGALKIMAWTKAKMTVVTGIGILLVAGTTTVTVKEIQEQRTYSWQNLPAYGNELDEVRPQVRIVPSKYSSFGECSRNGKILGLGMPAGDVLAAAYGVAPAHVIFATGVPRGVFDFIANLPTNNEAALRQEVRRKFGLVGRRELRATDALLLEVKDAAKLQSHAFSGQSDFSVQHGLQFEDEPLSSVADGIELLFKKPVVVATGTSGKYHLQFLADEFPSYNTKWSSIETRIESLRQKLLEELGQDGLDLVPTNMPVEMLVVEKTK